MNTISSNAELSQINLQSSIPVTSKAKKVKPEAQPAFTFDPTVARHDVFLPQALDLEHHSADNLQATFARIRNMVNQVGIEIFQNFLVQMAQPKLEDMPAEMGKEPEKVRYHVKRSISGAMLKLFELPLDQAQAVAFQTFQHMMQRYDEEQRLRQKRELLKTRTETASNDPNADDPLGSVRGIYFNEETKEQALKLLIEKGVDDKETLEKIQKGKFSVRTYFSRCGKDTCNTCKIEPSHKIKTIQFSYKGKQKVFGIPRDLYNYFNKNLIDHLKFNKAFIKKQLKNK